MKQVKTLAQLAAMVEARQSVRFKNLTFGTMRMPAAILINMPGTLIHRVIQYGLYINEPKRKTKPNTLP